MLSIQDHNKIGKLGKANGTKGAFTVIFDQALSDDAMEMPILMIMVDGYLVPFFIESFTLNTPQAGTVKFDHINSIEETREFVNCDVYIHKNEESSNIYSDNALSIKGYKLIDKNLGNIGTVVDILDDTSNPLLVCDHKNNELLVPYHEDIICSIDDELKIVTTLLPDGLISLNE